MNGQAQTRWQVAAGDILDLNADVLVCSANPWLNLSGGVGGALALRYGPAMQGFLHTELAVRGVKWLPAGTVLVAPACGTPYRAVVHAVGVDPTYQSSMATVTTAVESALAAAAQFGSHITLTAIGTGYGPLSLKQFGEAMLPLMKRDWGAIRQITIGVRHDDEAAELRGILGVKG